MKHRITEIEIAVCRAAERIVRRDYDTAAVLAEGKGWKRTLALFQAARFSSDTRVAALSRLVQDPNVAAAALDALCGVPASDSTGTVAGSIEAVQQHDKDLLIPAYFGAHNAAENAGDGQFVTLKWLSDGHGTGGYFRGWLARAAAAAANDRDAGFDAFWGCTECGWLTMVSAKPSSCGWCRNPVLRQF
jgi:hypothetical protein